MLGHTAHVDTFTRDNLPPAEWWPDLLLDGFEYPERLNVGVELTDRMVETGFGDHTALIGNGRRRTYKELADWTNRLAHVLVEDLGVVPGNRVLIRSANNPAMVAAWLAATKAGAVVVNTMPMLRAGELGQIVDKAEITHALCDTRLMDEMAICAKGSKFLRSVEGSTAARTTMRSWTGWRWKNPSVSTRSRRGATTWRFWALHPEPRAARRPRCIFIATC